MQLLKNLRAFYGTKALYRVHKSPLLVLILSQLSKEFVQVRGPL
jgi:hypothetical protein